MSRIADNWRRVNDRVAQAAARAGREPGSVAVCAVTKRCELAVIREAVAAGARILGENRVQEASEKIPGAADLGPVQWHLIGHLQRNKARRAVELFDCVQAVDSLTLARRLSDLGRERGEPVRGLAEILTSDEGSKSGLALPEAAEALAEMAELDGLELQGLMTMAPNTMDEARVRRSFIALRELRDAVGPETWELSMGMTSDFEWAVEEGSTIVRVGTGIFG